MSDEQLQQDTAQTAALEPAIEPAPGPAPKKRGRRVGSKNAKTKRAETAERVRRWRERQREKAEAEEEANAQREKFSRERRAEGLLFFGETSACENCINITEEIEKARLWARLLNAPDIQPGENKRAYILQTLRSWCGAGCPLLHLESETLSTRRADIPDVNAYQFPDGADAPYEVQEEAT